MFNFFNTNDVALALWVGNQLAKPQTPSYYMGANLQPFLVPNTLVTDPREVMAFCARPRSYAVGAQSGVLGVIHGDELDLTGQFQFGDSVADHSGQWKRSIQEVWNLYSILLDRLQGVP
jgi:hypothetical protein